MDTREVGYKMIKEIRNIKTGEIWDIIYIGLIGVIGNTGALMVNNKTKEIRQIGMAQLTKEYEGK